MKSIQERMSKLEPSFHASNGPVPAIFLSLQNISGTWDIYKACSIAFDQSISDFLKNEDLLKDVYKGRENKIDNIKRLFDKYSLPKYLN